MSIAENLNRIKNEIPAHVKLVAVTKTYPVERILEAYNAGHKIFGENRVQELAPKHQDLPGNIECLLQIHIAQEETKFGLDLEEADELLRSNQAAGMKNVRITGLMGMATLTE